MILWTIQPEKVWKEIKNNGVLVCTENNITDDFYIHPYQWMNAQMKKV
ncbi:MAG: DUF3841 domain-containing protein [Desulfobacterales bacterium]|nr:DUF3841 domain-containing protein [Desulfobacterales bacterium]